MAAQSQPPKVQETGGGIKIEGFKLTSSHPSDSPFQFGTLKLPTTLAESGKDEAADEERNVSLEHEPDVHFKPIVTLPSVDIQTGEEEEEVIFSHRAKLYRFDSKDKQWKDRGIGDMKILKHKTGGKVRLLMRRDQILRICCNHCLTANMSLTPHNNSDKAWTWYTPSDFADEVPKPEKFVLRFKLPEVARQFKAAFDECVTSLKQPNSQASEEGSPSSSRPIKTPPSEYPPLGDSWSCAACLVQNKQHDNKCVACGTSRPDATSEPPAVCDEAHEVAAPTTTFLEETPTTYMPSAPFVTKDVDVETKSEVVVDEDVEITAVDMPSQEKIDLAKKYMLPPTFFNYENKPPCPGCRGCDNETEGEVSSTNSVKPTGEEKEQSRLAGTEADVKTATDVKDVPEDSTKWKPFAGLFSLSSSSPSFADIAASGSSGPLLFGAPATKSEGFFRAGEVLFSSRAEPQDDENYNPESETDAHFKPLVSLPEVAVKTGEEDEEAIFTHRAKLYRFDSNVKQWKERGVGDIKILSNKTTSKTRILMRRDQILKLCCNHFITADMSVVPTAGSDKSLTWHTPCDYADEVAKPEKFSVKFKLPETAQEFKKIFDRCAAALHSTDTEQQDEQKSTEQTDSSDEKGRSPVVTGETLKQKLAPPPGTWSCETCLVSNPPSETKCAACGSVKPAYPKTKEQPHDLETEQPPVDTGSSQLRFPLEFSSPPPPNSSFAVNSATSPLHFPLSLGPHVSPSTPASEPSSPDKVEGEEEEEGGTDREQEDKEEDGEAEKGEDAEKGVREEWKEERVEKEEEGKQEQEKGKEETQEEKCREKEDAEKGGEEEEEDKFREEQKRGDAEKEEKEEWEEGKVEKGNQKQEKGREERQEKEQEGQSREGEEEEEKEVWEEERVEEEQDREEEQEKDIKDKQEEECERPIGSPSAVLQLTGEGEEAAYKETKKLASPSQPTLNVPIQPPTSNENDDGDVVFLLEELPDQALIEKAEMFMLPRSFYLYEKKPPCPGCRGCRDESDSEDVVPTAALTECADETKETSPPEVQELADHQGTTISGGLHFQPSGMLSFSDLVSKSSTGFADVGQRSGSFMFQGAGQQLFSSKVEEDTNPEAEADIQFRPIVSLPETYTVSSWDDDADTLFSHRAKLFRFDVTSKQWKERGVGDMKILKHRKTEKVRMIMRRDQILKICCNHHITADMSLKPGSSEKLWIWFTPSDYSDETPKPERLQIRFKHAETAKEFKKVFDECVRELQSRKLEDVETKSHASYQTPQHADDSLASKFKPSAVSWTCNVCLISNTAEVIRCAACSTLKEGFHQQSHAEEKSLDSVPKAPSPLDAQQSSIPSITFGDAGGMKLDLLQSTPLQATSGEYKPISLSEQPKFGTNGSS